jgi:hypothetical protein
MAEGVCITDVIAVLDAPGDTGTVSEVVETEQPEARYKTSNNKVKIKFFIASHILHSYGFICLYTRRSSP